MNKKGVLWIVSIIAVVVLAAVYVTLDSDDILSDYLSSDENNTLSQAPIIVPEYLTLAPEYETQDYTYEYYDYDDYYDYELELEIEIEPADFAPYAIAETHPDLLLYSAEVQVRGEIMDSYTFSDRIDFGFGFNYSQVDGITTFRGNNQRDTAAFGRADIQNGRLSRTWSARTGSYRTPDDILWTGTGWTGQPLIVRWPNETRQMMNMHDWAKAQDDLVEVIYPALDGNIYFLELETGRATRNILNIGFPFKGSGAIDPRGYPLLYVGAGDHSHQGRARIFIISLVDGSVLYTFGAGDPFAPRSWPMADASPLVDAHTDKLIYPSENGVLYIIRLNSEFDPIAGTMTINPDEPYRWRFRGIRSGVDRRFWLGFEASPAIWRGHIFLADNGGHLICLDLNTLEIVWILDNIDNSDSTPVIAIEDGHPFIYISMSFNGNGIRVPAGTSTHVPIRKIDAVTGAIVWETDHRCYVANISGGVQSTIALGRYDLEGLIFVSIARTPSPETGLLVALDRQTGETVWEFRTGSHGWGSPVAVYNEDGRGFIIHTELVRNMFLLDGLTGQVLDRMDLGGHIEASPAVFESMIVIGTRWQDILGIRLS